MIQFDKLKDYFGIGAIHSCPTTAIQPLPRILLSQHLLVMREAMMGAIRLKPGIVSKSGDLADHLQILQELGKLTKLADLEVGIGIYGPR